MASVVQAIRQVYSAQGPGLGVLERLGAHLSLSLSLFLSLSLSLSLYVGSRVQGLGLGGSLPS